MIEINEFVRNQVPVVFMIDAVFVVNNRLDVLAEKQYGIHVDRQIIEKAMLLINAGDVLPVNEIDNHHVIVLSSGVIYLVGIVARDTDAMYVIDILKHLLRLFEARFGSPIEEYIIMEDITSAYRVLDYTIDSGFPLLDESNALSAVLPVSGNGGELNIMYPWRAKDLKYDSPELLVTITEFLDFSIGKSGEMSFFQVRGLVQVMDHLSGVPEVTLTWNRRPEFDDFSVHRCLEWNGWSESMTFVPPDGYFDLMNYRITSRPVVPPITIEGQIGTLASSVDIDVTFKTSIDLVCVVVYFTLPAGFTSQSLVVKPGKLAIRDNMVMWTVGAIKPGGTWKIDGPITGAFDTGLVVQPTFTIEFQSTGSLLSGHSLASTNISSFDIVPFTGVKYQTVNGRYQIQTGGFF